VLEKGVLVEQGETAQVLGAPAHPYTRKLIASLPQPGMVRDAVRSERPVLLSAQKVCVNYAGKAGWLFAGSEKLVVREVDLELREGETLALVGASGSGKTTLGRALMGLKPLSGGTILFEGRNIVAMPARTARDFRRAVQLVFQDPFSSLDPRLTVGTIIGAPLRHIPGLTRRERMARVEEVLESVNLPGFAGRFAHQMSGGQRQRIAIARAIVSRPKLVVADEPISALDVTVQRQILSLFQALQAQYGFAALFITHDLAVVEEIADRVLVMSEGRIVESGETAKVFAAPQHPYTRELLAATPGRAVRALKN